MTRLQAGIITIVFAAATTLLIVQHRINSDLRRQNNALSDQIAQLRSENRGLTMQVEWSDAAARSAPLLAVHPNSPVPTNSESTNWIERLLKGDEDPAITSEQAEAYLRDHGRTASSLLAAFRTTRDPKFLDEAKRMFPEDPEVAFEAVFERGASAEDRRRWLDVLRRVDPDNAMGACLSAADYFKSGQTEKGIQELLAASGGWMFEDYTLQRIQSDDEAFRSAGYSEADAKMASTWHLTLPHLAEFKKLAESATELAKVYREAGDDTSAQVLLTSLVGMAQHFNGSQGATGLPLITQLVGIGMERIALTAMDPGTPYGAAGLTVSDRLAELTARRETLRDLTMQSGAFHQVMSPQDWVNYNDRTRLFGEENAMRWLLARFGAR